MNEKAFRATLACPLLDQLYFYLTADCNLRCRHCWIEPRHVGKHAKASGIDPVIFETILHQATALGLTGIKLTGGEPLLHPQIEQLLDILYRMDLRLTVETNGTLCHPDLAKRLAGFSGVSVSVSLDGADAVPHDWIRGSKGSFAAAVRGIENLASAGIRPQIIMTVMRCNKNQMKDLVHLAEGLGAGSVKFNVLQPTARGEKLHETGESLGIAELIALGRWVDEELSPKAAISLCYHQPPAFRGMGRLFGKTGDGCQTCGILGVLGVLADGSYALCGIGATIPDLIFGHAAKDSLQDIWHDHPVLKQIREGLPRKLSGVCSRCLMKNLCLGSCMAQNYYRDGNLWAPFWYCEQAFQKGLFPESRLYPEMPAAHSR